MYFSEVIGQEKAKRSLIQEAKEGRVPHARLLAGTEGVGKLPLALSYARYLVCNHPGETEACGRCAACRMMDAWAHPDVHYVFPVVKRKGRDTVSDDCLEEWRAMLDESAYCTAEQWLQRIGDGDRQAQIYVRESEVLMRKCGMRPAMAQRKVVVVWLPERMNADCANKLLKLLEEPPEDTVFMLVTEDAEALLPTLKSRTRRMDLPGIGEAELAEALQRKCGMDAREAEAVAHRSEGSWTRALADAGREAERERMLSFFREMMRNAYGRRVREMKVWSEAMASLGRERQKAFLCYALRMVRENFVRNFGKPELVRMDGPEEEFAERFAPYVNERNVLELADELQEAERHIAQNVNPRMVFFDLALKMTARMR